jgi:hypothetical protein
MYLFSEGLTGACLMWVCFVWLAFVCLRPRLLCLSAPMLLGVSLVPLYK